MWPDPDLVKRKPRQLRGTPANKFYSLLVAGIGCTFTGVLFAISCTPWFQRAVEPMKRKALASDNTKSIFRIDGNDYEKLLNANPKYIST